MARLAIGVAFSLGLANATSTVRPSFSRYPVTNFKLLAALEESPAPGLAINLTRVDLLFFDILTPSFLIMDLNQRISYTEPGNPDRIAGKNIGQIMASRENTAEANKTDDQQRRDNH